MRTTIDWNIKLKKTWVKLMALLMPHTVVGGGFYCSYDKFVPFMPCAQCGDTNPFCFGHLLPALRTAAVPSLEEQSQAPEILGNHQTHPF